MTPPIHVGLAQRPIKTGRGRGLSQILRYALLLNDYFMIQYNYL